MVKMEMEGRKVGHCEVLDGMDGGEGDSWL